MVRIGALFVLVVKPVADPDAAWETVEIWVSVEPAYEDLVESKVKTLLKATSISSRIRD